MAAPSQGNLDSRSQVLPAYLGTGDPSSNGFGTVSSSEPQNMQAQYENIFGPAVRDIKWDEQRHKRHQRWHLPDALKGASPYLTDRVDGLITDATTSPFTKNILPYLYMDNPDKKIKWNVYSFDEGFYSFDEAFVKAIDPLASDCDVSSQTWCTRKNLCVPQNWQFRHATRILDVIYPVKVRPIPGM